jgi:carboxymethylenebutenolidase
MTRRDVSIPTADGTMDASVHTPDAPDSDGPWPAVIMFPDAGGVRPTFHEMAQRLADLGYVVVLPNPFYRVGPFEPFDMMTVFGDPDERARLMTLVGSVTKENATRDTDAILTFLAEQPDVAGDKVGTTGYCMGGGLSLNAAGRFPDRVAAAASFHGGRIATEAPDSPHLLADAMTAKVYVAGAENDASFDDEQFERLSAALVDAGVDHELLTYPALHGFAVPDNPTYDEAAAARHWQALESLYDSTLTSP